MDTINEPLEAFYGVEADSGLFDLKPVYNSQVPLCGSRRGPRTVVGPCQHVKHHQGICFGMSRGRVYYWNLADEGVIPGYSDPAEDID